MPNLPPLMRDQRKIDADQLRLLATLHFVMAGLAMLGLGALFAHWLMMHTVFESPEMWKSQSGGPPPREFLAMFKWMYVIFGSGIIVVALANLVSGVLIQKRRARVLSLIVAGLNCMGLPLATLLGVFTLIVLLRDSVVESYEAAASPVLNGRE
jgi:hypothetical protein